MVTLRMSSDESMDWNNSPNTWSAVFEDADEGLPAPDNADRPLHKQNTSSSISLDDPTLSEFGGLRYLASPFINKYWPLDVINETPEIEGEKVEVIYDGPVEEDHDKVMKRSLSYEDVDTCNRPISIDLSITSRADNEHIVPGSLPMHFASSLPNIPMSFPLDDDTPSDPTWGKLAFSSITHVSIFEKLEIYDVLSPRTDFTPKTGAQIKATPVWAQPPIASRCIRADWGHINAHYKASIVKDFGEDFFFQSPGWWQEVMKGSKGRIAVKTDDHYYTVYCYLPGQTADSITVAQARKSIVIQADCYRTNDHFHWKVKLPQGNLKKVDARMHGNTLTVQIQKEEFEEALDWMNFNPMTALIAPTDMIPKAIYGL